ncbi:hypothetical protein F503_08059 [Ophiostoma piceae UAMH 11346]|uniref:Uncharacterized protein n=1 Tax=Ophiostoma piceae (strain UAMH 11346) TaxID=1262450 RepID=S3CLL6_OPHP1|nr:hypothetical protein F503_08059 [Ophiostoma piceae UAMH 11346]
MLTCPRLARSAARQASIFPRQIPRQTPRQPSRQPFTQPSRQPSRQTSPSLGQTYLANTPQPTLYTSRLFSSTPNSMSSDDAYAAFLDKANQDVGSDAPASTSSNKASVNHQQDVPKVLVSAAQDQFYVSDADEPFVAVAVPLKGEKLPTEDDFIKAAGLPQSTSSISILDPIDWDRSGQYKALLDAVREAGEGNDVRVYKVQQDSTRVEYWLVTTTSKGQLVGFKAKAIES